LITCVRWLFNHGCMSPQWHTHVVCVVLDPIGHA
jgi:hypothetical protein